MAGSQHYQAPLDGVRWQASSQKRHCSLTHNIPLYGQANFAQSEGGQLGFTLRVKRHATHSGGHARLRSLPPEWKHQVDAVDLGEVTVHKGEQPFRFDAPLSRRLLAELQKGMFLTLSYRDWADARDRVNITLPGIHIKPALDEFITCLSKLPVYLFADFKNIELRFDFGKASLTKKDRNRLDKLAMYLNSDPSVKQIVIEGHTDNIGRRRSNDKLGTRRSQAIKQYLAGKGIASNKFKLSSWGERRPKASNRTDQGRALNRRASVTLNR
ncbi:MAG: OmpA family protein [Gammaproteobacteria bacterium]|nr:OmpA family protein [Gammaproteobacteria bacterium]